MIVRFVCVIRVPVCARACVPCVSRVCPGMSRLPRCLFTGKKTPGAAGIYTGHKPATTSPRLAPAHRPSLARLRTSSPPALPSPRARALQPRARHEPCHELDAPLLVSAGDELEHPLLETYRLKRPLAKRHCNVSSKPSSTCRPVTSPT